MRWKAPKIWPAGDVILIGGGPSFKKIDQSVLKALSLAGQIHVIGINKAYRVIPDSGEWMHVLFYGDSKFYHTFRRIKERNIYSFPGLRVCCDAQSSGDAAIKVLGRDRRAKFAGLSPDPTLIYWGQNSGAAAINLAYHFTGPEGRLFLFGYDMNPDDRQKGITHWHEGYVEMTSRSQAQNAKIQAKEYYQNWRSKIEVIATRTRKVGFQIFNVNPASAIESFPRITFEKFVEMVKEKSNG